MHMSRRQLAWIVIVVVDVAYVAWGAGVAIAPEHLLGPGGRGILPAGFEGYTGASWAELGAASPRVAGYVRLVFRLYGIYCVLFGFMGTAIATTAFRRGERWAWWTLLVANTVALLSAMSYDRIANAIGPFEMTEYLGVLLVWAALGLTVPRAAGGATPGQGVLEAAGTR
jgi:hypothetical protein